MIRLDTVAACDLTAVETAPNRIKQIGIELEGGWDRAPADWLIERDGSVRFAGGHEEQALYLQNQFAARWNGQAGSVDALRIAILADYAAMVGNQPMPRMVGEIPSPPLDLDKWSAWMRECYPTHVNNTCGMHVHMSFESPLVYQRLMTPVYPKTVIEEFKKWGHTNAIDPSHVLWERLNGLGIAGTPSEFCQPVFQADLQAKRTEKRFQHFEPGHRYTVVNYCWAIRGRRTIECRILPMFEGPDTAESAIKHLIDITNKFLYATKTKQPRITCSAVSKGEEMNRRIEVRI